MRSTRLECRRVDRDCTGAVLAFHETIDKDEVSASLFVQRQGEAEARRP